MTYGLNCACPCCRIRSLCWPLVLIAAGVLFSLDLIWHHWPIGKTWPVLLIVWGVCGLAARLAPNTPHGVPPASPSGGQHAP
jgi:hypothetical protein